MATKLWKVSISETTAGPTVDNTEIYHILAGTVSSAIARAIREYKPDFAGGVVGIEPSQEGLLSVSRPEPKD